MNRQEIFADSASCWHKAHKDEPMFILLGRDKAAEHAIRTWADWRVSYGSNKYGDKKIQQAYEVAKSMREWKENKNLETDKTLTDDELIAQYKKRCKNVDFAQKAIDMLLEILES